MRSDAQILDQLHQAFATCPRPDHFTNHIHCCECAEHDETLRSRDLQTLAIEDIGNGGWDPICFISPAGFAYYLPALARHVLADPSSTHGWYGSQFLFHIQYDGPNNARIQACTPGQRRAVVALLHHLVETRAQLADRDMCSHELLRAIDYWSESPTP